MAYASRKESVCVPLQLCGLNDAKCVTVTFFCFYYLHFLCHFIVGHCFLVALFLSHTLISALLCIASCSQTVSCECLSVSHLPLFTIFRLVFSYFYISVRIIFQLNVFFSCMRFLDAYCRPDSRLPQLTPSLGTANKVKHTITEAGSMSMQLHRHRHVSGELLLHFVN